MSITAKINIIFFCHRRRHRLISFSMWVGQLEWSWQTRVLYQSPLFDLA